jgi:hypothetical protein
MQKSSPRVCEPRHEGTEDVEVVKFHDPAILPPEKEVVNTIKGNTEALLEASRDIGLETNAEKTKYMIMFRHPNSGHNQNIDESFEKVATFKYLGTTLTNQNDIHDEIKSRLNLGNACYYSVQNLLSSHLI